MPMDSKDKNVEKNKHFLMSVEFAVQGVKTVFEEERNMRNMLRSVSLLYLWA